MNVRTSECAHSVVCNVRGFPCIHMVMWAQNRAHVPEIELQRDIAHAQLHSLSSELQKNTLLVTATCVFLCGCQEDKSVYEMTRGRRNHMINAFRVTLLVLGKCCTRLLELQNKLLIGVSM